MSTGTAPIEATYALTDHHGRSVTERDFAGQFQLIFFGFTHCRKVCPRVLTSLSGVLDGLGEIADRLQPLYVTVDPDRDTPEVMRRFLEAGYPRFLGLTGTLEACRAAQLAFKVFAQRAADPDRPEDYAVPHSALTYVLDPEGRYLTHFLDVADVERIATRLRGILEGASASPGNDLVDAAGGATLRSSHEGRASCSC